MQVRVFVLPGGNIQVFVDEGTFEQAQAATLTVLAQLRAKGIAAELVGEIEQHRDGGSEHVHVKGTIHVH